MFLCQSHTGDYLNSNDVESFGVAKNGFKSLFPNIVLLLVRLVKYI
jgi:hypothetical protein